MKNFQLYGSILTAFLMLCFVAQSSAHAAGCRSMAKDLTRLRHEYREYTSLHPDETNEEQFQGLVRILDKIVDLKDAMRRANCRKIPKRKPPKKDELPDLKHDKMSSPPAKNK